MICGVPRDLQNFVEVDRLGEDRREGVSIAIESFVEWEFVGVAAEEDDVTLGMKSGDAGGGLEAEHLGHHDVHEDQMRMEGIGKFEGLTTIEGFGARVSGTLEKGCEKIDDGGFVVDDQDAEIGNRRAVMWADDEGQKSHMSGMRGGTLEVGCCSAL